MTDDTGLKHAVLGLRPYALIELKGAEEDGNEIELSLRVEFGGGLSRAAGKELLEAALEGLED